MARLGGRDETILSQAEFRQSALLLRDCSGALFVLCNVTYKSI